MNHIEQYPVEISMDQIIASIKATRDLQIEGLTEEPVLLSFLEHYYDTIAISSVKKAFLLKDLAELKSSSLNLSHYASLITKMKEMKILDADPSHELFLNELKELFQKYVTAK